jgi:hypothetical protein
MVRGGIAWLKRTPPQKIAQATHSGARSDPQGHTKHERHHA